MPQKTVAIVQSNYIPWKGYFDLIDRVDEFILYDDVQYTRRDWRNRNKIKTPNGLQWLTIPVRVTGKFFQPIKDTQVRDQHWRKEHWKSIAQNYARAPYFDDYAPHIEPLYADSDETYLSRINYTFLTALCELLEIDTDLRWSSDYELVEGKTERLVSLCQQAGATRYLSGPAAQAYMDESLFAQAGIELAYMDYSGYPEYEQLHPPFEHGVSILDVLFNTGPNAPRYVRRPA